MNSEYTQASKTKRAQLKHLLIDVDFFDKPKARALLHKKGPIAQLYLIRIYAALSRATGATISRDAALGIAWELRIEADAPEILQYCAEQEMLEISGEVISNSRVASDQESLHKKQERWRKAKGKEATSEDVPRGSSAEGARKSEDTEQLNTEDLNRSKETVRRPESQGVGHPDTPPRPLAGVSEPVLAAVERWRLYLRTKYHRELDEIQREQLVLNWSARPQNELIAGINQSIEKGYKQIIYKPPEEKLPPKPPEPVRPRLPEWVPPWEADKKTTKREKQGVA